MKKQIKFKKNLIFKRIIFIILMLLILGVIFNFSSQNQEESGKISEKVTQYIVNNFARVKNMDVNLKNHYIEKLHPIIRKLAHFSLYAVLGFATMGLFCTFDIKNKYKVLWSILIGMTYALSDEFHQCFSPGRGPSLMDVGIDTSGVLTGIFIMILTIILFDAISEWFKK